MSFKTGLSACLLTVLGFSSGAFAQSHAAAADFIEGHCLECHNRQDQSAAALFAGLFFDELDVSDVSADPETWEKVVRKLSAGMMPPASEPRPDPAARAAFLGYLETELDALAAANPNPGRPALHRMNRNEYQNAIRDLLHLDIDAAALLPADDSSFGFDNIAASLSISPVLLEGYVSAAGKISRLALGDMDQPDGQTKFVVPGDMTQNDHLDGMPFGTRGGARFTHYFPLDAEYAIRADLITRGGRMFGSNLGRYEELEVMLDGERIGLFDLSEYDAAEGLIINAAVTAGPHELAAAFIRKNHAPVEDINRPFEFSLFEPAIDPSPYWTFVPHLASMTVTGPFNPTGVGTTPARERILICQPTAAAEEAGCAREILESLATRAYRAPVGREQLSELMSFYEAGRANGDFESGIELALRRILASPEFIVRFEREPAAATPGEAFDISDLELASRLSFFLWSSLPDDELLELAADGRLSRRSVLLNQVERMLADPRSEALISNFAGQWLYLRNLEVKGGVVEVFPDFDDNLRQAFRTETEMFFASIVREDRSLLDLLTADYTFVNERLAKHYGIEGVYGSHFRRVQHTNDARRGLLGQGSLLTVTSNPDRTSPVQRGVWVLENIVGAPIPTPPPNVPDLAESEDHEAPQTLRAQMEVHRERPFCSGCHKIMDPIGFALENFDGIGRWREMENGQPINAAARLVDGTEIDGAADLRAALLSYSDRFVQTVAEKLLTYALGRGLEYYDMPVVRSIARGIADDDYRFSALVQAIVLSDPFLNRAAEAPVAPEQIVAGR